MLSKDLLEILCCPKCKGELNYKLEENKLICKNCNEDYSVVDDIPIMLPKSQEEKKSD
ncbi:MAG: Trm112 family protein [Bacteroidota bacterium]